MEIVEKMIAVPPFYFYRREDVKRIPEALAAGCGAGPENLVHTALRAEQIEHLHLLHFDGGASYPIRFGCLKRSYQWSVIEAFIRIAQESV